MFASARIQGLLLATAAPVLWSFGGVIIRSVEAGPWEVAFWRPFGHLVPALLILLLPRRNLIVGDALRAGWVMPASAVLLAVSFVVHVLSITHTTIANTLILQSVSPLMVIALAWVTLGERPSNRAMASIAVAFLGLLLVVGGSLGAPNLAGDALALVVAVVSAVNVILVRRRRDVSLAPATVLAAVASMLVCLPFASPWSVSFGDIALLALLGTLQITAGLLCFLAALRRLPAAEVSMLTLLEPVLGPIWAWLAVGEQPATTTLAGGAVVLLALAGNAAWTLRGRGRERTAHAP